MCEDMESDSLPHLEVQLVEKEVENDKKGFYYNFVQAFKNDTPDEKVHELIFDYLVGEGLGEVAKTLAEESPYELPSNDIFFQQKVEERGNIREDIVNGKIMEAIDKIEVLCPSLLNQDSELHFVILRQQLVELIRKKDDEQSLDFAQKYLSDKTNQSREQMHRLEQTYALMAFDNPENSIFGNLMREDQRQMLAHEVNIKIMNYLNLSPHTKLESQMKLDIWNKAHIRHSIMTLEIPADVAGQIGEELFSKEDYGRHFNHHI